MKSKYVEIKGNLNKETRKILERVEKMTRSYVVVGVPSEESKRTDSKKGSVNNAMLAYVHEFGSPANNTPPRPFIVPGVTAVKDSIAPVLKGGIIREANGKKHAVNQALQQVGILATDSIRKTIIQGDFEPLKPATIRNRARDRKYSEFNRAKAEYKKLVSEGYSNAQAQTMAGIKPLIDTAQLLNSISFKVRNNGSSGRK